MTTNLSKGQIAPLSAVIATYGPWAVLAAALRALLFSPAGPDADDLPDYLRDDIGLPARGSPPPRPAIPVRW